MPIRTLYEYQCDKCGKTSTDQTGWIKVDYVEYHNPKANNRSLQKFLCGRCKMRFLTSIERRVIRE